MEIPVAHLFHKFAQEGRKLDTTDEHIVSLEAQLAASEITYPEPTDANDLDFWEQDGDSPRLRGIDRRSGPGNSPKPAARRRGRGRRLGRPDGPH